MSAPTRRGSYMRVRARGTCRPVTSDTTRLYAHGVGVSLLVSARITRDTLEVAPPPGTRASATWRSPWGAAISVRSGRIPSGWLLLPSLTTAAVQMRSDVWWAAPGLRFACSAGMLCVCLPETTITSMSNRPAHTQFVLLRCCPAWRDWFGWTTCGFCFQAAHIAMFSESRHPHTRHLPFYPKCSECRVADRAA